MKEHPDKHIRKAIATALARGWILLLQVKALIALADSSAEWLNTVNI